MATMRIAHSTARRIATDLTEGASYADSAASVLTGRQMWSDHFAMISGLTIRSQATNPDLRRSSGVGFQFG